MSLQSPNPAQINTAAQRPERERRRGAWGGGRKTAVNFLPLLPTLLLHDTNTGHTHTEGKAADGGNNHQVAISWHTQTIVKCK